MTRAVLCVDDDRDLCQILAKTLEGEGYRVTTAFDGEEALALAAGDPPDLVLLDLILPRRDGFEVLEGIRALDGPACQTPVVVVSGCSPTPEYHERAARLRAAALLTKPVPLEKLLAVVKEHAGEAKEPAGPDAPDPAARAPQPVTPVLSGSLDRLPFPALLHHLHGLRASGVLHLSSGKKRKWIQVRGGHPVAVRSNLVNECLGNFLVRSGRISQTALEKSLQQMKGGKLQGEILVAMEILSEEEIAAALRAQADEKLFQLFSWKAGKFQFEMDGRLQRANTLGVERSPASLILHGVRHRFPMERIDAYLNAHRDCVVAPGESPFYRFQETDLDPAEQTMLRGLGGPRRLGDLLDGEGEPLRRTLYGLLSAGLLELRKERPGGPSRPVPQRAIPQVATPRGAAREQAVSRAEPTPGDDTERAELAALAERFREQGHYEILGLQPGASEVEIQDAYARMSEQTHPDRVGTSSDAVKRLAEEVFGYVARAYETLIDPRRRERYHLDQRRDEREAAKREEGRQALEAELQFQEGEGRLRQRDYEGALRCFQSAVSLYPEEGEYHAYYGWALHLRHPGETAKIEEAIKHVRRGLKLASHREKPYLFMGHLSKAAGRLDAAEKMFARAVQIQPHCVEALRELRFINMRRRRGLIGRLFGR
jgi:CheY-like chemotaxis protein/curved DNA-binding protein CbpA